MIKRQDYAHYKKPQLLPIKIYRHSFMFPNLNSSKQQDILISIKQKVPSFIKHP